MASVFAGINWTSINVIFSPKGYRIVAAPPLQYWAGLSPNLCVYFLRDPSANTQYHCSVDHCTDTFTEKEIGNHLRAKHYGIEAYDDVTCKECGRTVHAKSYQDHFLQLHSERSIHCAYCNSRQVRVQNLPRHFNVCPGLDKYWRTRKVCRTYLQLNELQLKYVRRPLNSIHRSLQYSFIITVFYVIPCVSICPVTQSYAHSLA